MIWNISGHVRVNVTYTGGSNAVVSGIFFASTGTVATPAPNPAASNASAAFLKLDATTEGGWQGNYGVDGYSIPFGSQKLPSYAALTMQNQSSWTWMAETSDPRARSRAPEPPQRPLGTAARHLVSTSNMTDGKTHQFSMYALDWDFRGRSETVQITDANTGWVLDTENVTNFTNGVYLAWNITGHVKSERDREQRTQCRDQRSLLRRRCPNSGPKQRNAARDHHPAGEPNGNRRPDGNLFRRKHGNRADALSVEEKRRRDQRRDIAGIHNACLRGLGQRLTVQRRGKQWRRKRDEQTRPP